jgi:uncharacterized membrane protein
LARVSLCLFLLVSGASVQAREERGWESSRGRSLWFLRRFINITFAAAVVSIATWIFDKETFVQFGVLHLIALSTILLWLFKGTSRTLVLAGSISIVAMFFLPASGSSSWLLPLGIMTDGFQSVDYVPLLPWFGLIALGAALWPLVPNSLRLERQYRKKTNTFTWPGRHSLVLYLLHQPLIWGFFYLLKR